MDLATVVKGSQAVTAEIGLEKLVETLMVIALEHAGAERGLLILPRGGELHIEAEACSAGDKGVSVLLRRGVARHPELPETILHYVSRTQEVVLLADAQGPHAFSADPYLQNRRSRSVVCVPLVKQAELVGLLYLENTLTPDVFTNARLAVLKLLASQAATSLENASLEEENASLAEKESLLKEVHHRVKNNLQLISSLLNLQASRISDPAVAELFAESRNRVRSMALVHENLYRAGNFARIPMATHIRTLCAHLSRAYGLRSQNIELTTCVGDIHLEMSRAVSCGLIVNELLSNAFKHAFPAGQAGHVSVELRADESSRIVLVVGDDGVGLPDNLNFARTDSLGLRLVRDLAEQLHGSVAIDSGGHGTTFAVTFDANASGGPSVRTA
jgi:two-component sensor histidine kinase